MNHAITMGIFWHLIGAASAACFYAPFKKVKHWSWETMWSVGGIVSWLILPWAISATLLPDFWAYYRSFSASTLLPVFLFGAMWGIGNINYGLTMRYLGMSMGIGIAIGITLIVGTLMTPIINGQFAVLMHTQGGQMTLLGGLMWYLQFFFYAWGHASIPAQYDYMSWMLHMSFYVLCGGVVGLVLKEWNNAGRRPVSVLSLGCVVIIIAANIVGLGMAS
ncbi:L-rhamnose/proton symporter RhaT [Klebsiella pneumoniae]|nr:hypothetical protein [Klebsiella pneumoniae]